MFFFVCLFFFIDRVPVGQQRTVNGKEGQEKTGRSESQELPEALHPAAFPQVPTQQFPTGSGTGRSRPFLTLPPGSNSLVRFLLHLPKINFLFQRSNWVRTKLLFNVLGNTSPRAISRAERERKVSMRLHRGAPANISSSDLTARHDQSRSQVRRSLWLLGCSGETNAQDQWCLRHFQTKMPIYNTAKQDMKQCVSMANQCSWFDYYAYVFTASCLCLRCTTDPV